MDLRHARMRGERLLSQSDSENGLDRLHAEYVSVL